MLIENTLFGIKNKIEDAIIFLQAHEPPEGYYLAFSGGKDSIVTDHLMKRAEVKYDTHMNLTSVDPPELLTFVREHYPGIELIKPKKSMHTLIIEKRMPPTRLIRYCCEWLKEHGGELRMVVTGVRQDESFRRSAYHEIEADTKIKNKFHVRPILRWTEADIWEYIEENRLPYCSLYDEGFSRIGCVMCPMSGKSGMLRGKERWPAIYKMYLGACEKSVQKRIADGLKTTWKTGQEMMDWWIYSQK